MRYESNKRKKMEEIMKKSLEETNKIHSQREKLFKTRLKQEEEENLKLNYHKKILENYKKLRRIKL